MLRLLHTADAHLGARHEDLGEAASSLRERQHAAFKAAMDLALAERVDAVLIAGDLFDANTASRRTVERAVAALARLAAARIRVVLIPGDHDAYTRSSVYRAYDLPSLAGGEMLTVLTPEQPWVHLETLDAVVVGPGDAARTGTGEAASPFADLPAGRVPSATWHIGLLHAALRDVPNGTAAGDPEPPARVAPAGHGEVSEAAIEASGLDVVALGHDHGAASGRAGAVTWAIAGPPEQVAADRGEPGTVNIITLDERGGSKTVQIETRVVGASWHRDLEVDAGQIASQDALIERLRAAADPELVLDVRIAGDRPDELVLEPAAIEQALSGAYLCIRVDDRSQPPLTTGALPPPETIAGAFIRNVEARIAELEAGAGDADGEAMDGAPETTEAADLREVLRLGRRLLAGSEVTR